MCCMMQPTTAQPASCLGRHTCQPRPDDLCLGRIHSELPAQPWQMVVLLQHLHVTKQQGWQATRQNLFTGTTIQIFFNSGTWLWNKKCAAPNVTKPRDLLQSHNQTTS